RPLEHHPPDGAYGSAAVLDGHPADNPLRSPHALDFASLGLSCCNDPVEPRGLDHLLDGAPGGRTMRASEAASVDGRDVDDAGRVIDDGHCLEGVGQQVLQNVVCKVHRPEELEESIPPWLADHKEISFGNRHRENDIGATIKNERLQLPLADLRHPGLVGNKGFDTGIDAEAARKPSLTVLASYDDALDRSSRSPHQLPHEMCGLATE